MPTEETMMPEYLLLGHYRGAPAAVNDVPMDQWAPEEITAHVQYMEDFAARVQTPASTSIIEWALELAGELSAAPGAGGQPTCTPRHRPPPPACRSVTTSPARPHGCGPCCAVDRPPDDIYRVSFAPRAEAGVV
ncbi:hypothetical protein A5789_31630 [Nocardia sp. 852002-51101_SCH5132738]|nr:hypothetical protein A5789_31630 [Nocardia sp. 852002-51101_SCH5132738]OBB46147.1 hypothetical protein A5748_24390 [Nocardia sp. 852002-51244_SCH5132740]OBF66509.1 hypothetical protein A9X06_05985 [Mycobacterium sp. 852002-51759_SCH5129042]